MIKRILSVALAALLTATSVFAAGSNAYIDTITATSTAGSVTFATTANNAPRAVTVRNDGNVVVYVDFGRTAVADSTTALPVAACESLTVTFNSGKPLYASVITSSGSASVRVIGAFDSTPVQVVRPGLALAYDVVSSAACAGNVSAVQTVNGASFLPFVESEQITLATGALVTDSTANLLRADSLIEAVVCRQTTAITTSTLWGLSDPTTANRFAAGIAIATPTIVGLIQNYGGTAAAGPVQAAAAKLRITVTGANPGAGVVRCSVFGRQAVVPAS